MKNISLLLLFLGIIFTSQAQDHKLKKTKIAKILTVELPTDFKLLTDDQMASKYTTLNRPLAVYTDPSGTADFSIIAKPSHFAAEDLPLMKEFYKSSIQNKFSEVRFLNEKLDKFNGEEFIQFEFISSLKDEGKSVRKMAAANYYTIIQYAIKNNQIYIFTFNVPVQLQAKWQKTANKIMESVKFR